MEIAGALNQRGEPFGIPTLEIDGNDVLAVHAESRRAVEVIRAGGGPRMMVFRTYRLGPHSKGDDDRDQAEIERARLRCPITLAGARLDRGWCDTVNQTIAARVATVVEELKNS